MTVIDTFIKLKTNKRKLFQFRIELAKINFKNEDEVKTFLDKCKLR